MCAEKSRAKHPQNDCGNESVICPGDDQSTGPTPPVHLLVVMLPHDDQDHEREVEGRVQHLEDEVCPWLQGGFDEEDYFREGKEEGDGAEE